MAERFFNQVNGTQGYCVYHQYMRKLTGTETQSLSFTFNTGTSLRSLEHFAVILDGSFHEDFYDPCQYEASGVHPLQGRGITIGETTTCKPWPDTTMGVDFEHFGGSPSSTHNVGCNRNTIKNGQTNILGGGCSVLTPAPKKSYHFIVEVNNVGCSYYVKESTESKYEYHTYAMPSVTWQDDYHSSSIMIYYVSMSGNPSEFSFCNIAASIT